MSEAIEAIKKAFHEGDASAVRSLFASNPELKVLVNQPIGPFNSPAILGVKSVAMLDVLLEAGADINARSSWWAGGFGLLDRADPDLAEYAIARGAKVDAHSAARLGKIDLLRIMLDANPSLVHVRGGDGQLPLHFASTVEIADLILDRGADINARDIDHVSTAAQWMIKSRQPIAKHLIDRGCETDLLMASAVGDNRLAAEILDRDPEAIRMRVSEEFFPLIGSENGGTIYQWELGWHVSAHQVAKDFGHEEVFQLLWDRSPADVRLAAACWLKEESLIPEGPAQLGPVERRQAAHAARNNDLPALRLMLRHGFPVDARSQHGATTLHWACWHGSLEMVSLVLNHGGDITDQANDYESAPISWAVYASEHSWNSPGADYISVVKKLLDAGAEKPTGDFGSKAVREFLATV